SRRSSRRNTCRPRCWPSFRPACFNEAAVLHGGIQDSRVPGIFPAHIAASTKPPFFTAEYRCRRILLAAGYSGFNEAAVLHGGIPSIAGMILLGCGMVLQRSRQGARCFNEAAVLHGGIRVSLPRGAS